MKILLLAVLVALSGSGGAYAAPADYEALDITRLESYRIYPEQTLQALESGGVPLTQELGQAYDELNLAKTGHERRLRAEYSEFLEGLNVTLLARHSDGLLVGIDPSQHERLAEIEERLGTIYPRVGIALTVSDYYAGTVSWSSEPDVAIPNGAGSVTDSIDVANATGPLTVSVTIDHEDHDELYVILVAPDGTATTIFERETGHAAGLQTFTYSSATYPGIMGSSAAGTWSLEVRDIYKDRDTGTLRGWSLIFADDAPETRPAPDHARTVTYQVGQLPEIPDPQIPLQAMVLAVENWHEYNPGVAFVESSEDPEVVVLWQAVHDPEHLGVARCDAGRCTIEIGLGRTDCNGRYVQAEANFVTNTIMHELGHVLGLGHHTDRGHLMYGDDEWTEVPFDARGYGIPPNYDGYFVGERELAERIELASARYNILDAQYDQIRAEYGDVLARFGLTPESVGGFGFRASSALAGEVNPIIERLNEKVGEINDIVDEWNELNEEWICYHPAPSGN